MKKMNFTLPNRVYGWLLMLALVIAYSNFSSLSAQCVLPMEDHVFISLSDNDCTATLTQEMFLTNDGATCTVADHYEFEVSSTDGHTIYIPKTATAVIDHTYLGKDYMLRLFAVNAAGVTINVGMCTFSAFDKMPPVITCPTDTVDIQCWQQLTYNVTATDNCTENPLVIKINETIWDNDCIDPAIPVNVFRYVNRWYIAKDASGNYSDTCHVTLRVNRLDDWSRIHFPTNYLITNGTAISCKDKNKYKDANGKFDPNKTGWPYIVYPDDHPTPKEITALDYQDTTILKNDCVLACNLASTYIDVNINTCPQCIDKVIRFWTVVESSCQYPSRFAAGIQTIEVTDTIPPVIKCPKDVEVTTNDLNCESRYTFPVPNITDECCNCTKWTIAVLSEIGDPVLFADTVATKSSVKRNLPYGENVVTYTAYDRCGNSSSCDFTVTVKDNTPPVAICQQFTTVSLTYDGVAVIHAPKFDSGSYDDCELREFKVRRMSNTCDGYEEEDGDKASTTPFDDLWFDYVHFCCQDVGRNPVTVVMRVWDRGGNFNDCMVQVTVQDKLPPQITCPPDLCVPCDYPFELDKMQEAFGTVVVGQENVKTHTLFTPYGAWYDADNDRHSECEKDLRFNDGFAHDNCNLTLTSTYEDRRTLCSQGNIVRTFTAKDLNGSVSCKQFIHFYNPRPFDGRHDVIWPVDVTMNGCGNEASYGPDLTGRPIMNEDACDLVGATYDDIIYHFNDDNLDAQNVCFKVIRRWTVMDWCQKYGDDDDRHGQFMSWHHDQVIMVSDTVKPYFTSPCVDKEVCTYDTECKGGYIELTMSAADLCTTGENLKWRYQIKYNVDKKPNGPFDIDSKYFPVPTNILAGPSANASGDYPIGKHRIVWTVWDQCGNTIVCDRYFTVKNCKKPTPICIDHVNVEMMPQDLNHDGKADWAMITLKPVICETCCNHSFHPCGYPISYSWSADVKDTLRTFDCDDKGLKNVQMWVTALMPDGTITQDYCETHINFQDNNNACPHTTQGIVKVDGKIETINKTPIPGVNIEVQGSELGPQSTLNNGIFSFDVDKGNQYNLIPTKDGDDLEGVSTLDLVLIQKHILGLKKFNNPYVELAANVNNDGKITASDIAALRKLILGQTSDIGKSWSFLPQSFQFSDNNNAFADNIPTSATINADADSKVDFYGIKAGDVNLSLIEPRSSSKLELTVDASNAKSGSFEIPVFANDMNNISGFQFTIQFNNEMMAYEGIEAGSLHSFSNDNIGLSKLDNGLISISWNRVGNNTLNVEEPIFILKFNSNNVVNVENALKINSKAIKSEAYNDNLDVMNIDLNFRNAENAKFALYQNTPNPFSEYTDVKFSLPEATNCTLSVLDMTGKVIYSKDGNFEKGLNSIRINKSDLNANGVLMYKLETGINTDTKKMILIK